MKTIKIYILGNEFVAEHLKQHYKNNLTDSLKKADIVINTVGILKENKHTYEESHIEFVKIPLLEPGSKKNHPSRYKHTKAIAKEIIKENLTNYAILKPSIILGKG